MPPGGLWKWSWSIDKKGEGHGLLPREICTTESFDNAMILDMAMGGSTNTVLHVLAIAREAGVEYDIERINQLSHRTPNICKVAPSSNYHVEDCHNAGGIHTILGSINRGCPGLLESRSAHCNRQNSGRKHRRIRHPGRLGARGNAGIGRGPRRRRVGPAKA